METQKRVMLEDGVIIGGNPTENIGMDTQEVLGRFTI